MAALLACLVIEHLAFSWLLIVHLWRVSIGKLSADSTVLTVLSAHTFANMSLLLTRTATVAARARTVRPFLTMLARMKAARNISTTNYEASQAYSLFRTTAAQKEASCTRRFQRLLS